MEANHKPLLAIAKMALHKQPFYTFENRYSLFFSYVYEFRLNSHLGKNTSLGIFLIAGLCNGQFNLVTKVFLTFQKYIYTLPDT